MGGREKSVDSDVNIIDWTRFITMKKRISFYTNLFCAFCLMYIEFVSNVYGQDNEGDGDDVVCSLPNLFPLIISSSYTVTSLLVLIGVSYWSFKSMTCMFFLLLCLILPFVYFLFYILHLICVIVVVVSCN